jgi:pimeloyl-ACP methyl ester carboxylesterase
VRCLAIALNAPRAAHITGYHAYHGNSRRLKVGVMVKRAYLETSIGQIHYRYMMPEKPTRLTPLLLLHMSPASSLIYENLINVVGQSRVCIAPDTPGYGNSDSHVSPPTIEEYAKVMHELVENLGLNQPIDVMGYHTGAMTAVAMANQQTDVIRKLILVSAPIFTAEELKRFDQIYATDSIWTVDGEKLLSLWKWFVEFFQVGTVNTVEEAGRIFYERLSGRELYWWGHHAAFAYDFAAALRLIEQPVLILNPNDDLSTMTPRAQDLARDSRILDLPTMTHGFLDSQLAEVIPILEAFLDG